ncbi:MAG: DUF6460 domain-containing protein [Kiloniellales bacterium]
MPRVTLGTLIKIVLVSLAVGLVMAWFGLTPQAVFRGALDRLVGAFDWAVEAFGWTVSYVLLGAAVVVPVWFLLYLLRAFKGRR